MALPLAASDSHDKLRDLGYAPWLIGVPSGKYEVDIWSRTHAEAPGWEYVVMLPVRKYKILNLDAPLNSSPDVVDLSDLLIKNKITRKAPELGYEWAITINGENDYQGNFATQELRDRAVDELFVLGVAGSMRGDEDDAIWLFEIEADGYQEDGTDQCLNVQNWVRKRLMSHQKGPQMDLRLAIWVDDCEAAAQAMAQGASFGRVDPQTLHTELHLAASLGRLDMIAQLMTPAELAKDIDTQAPGGDTALHKAALAGHQAFCIELFNAGANACLANDQRQTPADVTQGMELKSILRSMAASQAAREAIAEIGVAPAFFGL